MATGERAGNLLVGQCLQADCNVANIVNGQIVRNDLHDGPTGRSSARWNTINFLTR
jgi:hypothetical protein